MATKSTCFDGASVIQANHDEAALYISRGLSYDEQDQSVLACEMYEKGLAKIDAALKVRCEPHRSHMGPKWDKARAMQESMQQKKAEIKQRLEILCTQTLDGQSSSNEFKELPPTYNEACAFKKSPSIRQPLYPTLVIDNSSQCESVSCNNSSKVNQIFYISGGVQLFFISSDGVVNAPLDLNSLHIYQLSHANPATKQTWLQIGSWKYPLVRGKSTMLESSYGAFIFPDTSSEEGTAAVGVILPAEVDVETRKRFERHLQSLTALREDCEEVVIHKAHTYALPLSDFSDVLSTGLVIGAKYISFGLVKGATITGEYIHKGATALIQHVHPEETPAMIDQRVKDGVEVAKSISSVALTVSGFLVGALCDLTVALGNKIAPYVREQGAKFFENAFEINKQQAKDTVDGVFKVASGGMQGVSTVYLGLHDAAAILARSLSTETVNIVGHKYGIDAKDVVDSALSAIGNLALTTRSVQTVGAKAILLEVTAKNTGKALLRDYTNQLNQIRMPTGRK